MSDAAWYLIGYVVGTATALACIYFGHLMAERRGSNVGGDLS